MVYDKVAGKNMKTLKLQNTTYIVLTNGSIVKHLSTSDKRIRLLDKDIYTESYWNPHLLITHLDWNDTWAKFDWTHQHST